MYRHKVHYYETDKMSITHHSNYIRWMEEARIHFLEELGFGFDRIEADGVISPVVSVKCDYKMTTTFPDEIDIETRVEEFKGVKLILGYTMRNQEGKVVAEGSSTHCFMKAGSKIPMRLNKEYPEFYETLMKCLEE